MKIKHASGSALGHNGSVTASQSNFFYIKEISFYYTCPPEDLKSVVAVTRIYPKDKNPRRHLRDLLPKN